MPQFKYKELKGIYERSQDEFRAEFSGSKDLVRAVVTVLAHAKNDNGWPLAMLAVLRPKFAKALADWTANGYEEIRQQQESDTVRLGTHAKHLERHFSLLPKWHGEAVHISKDEEWFQRVRYGILELKSFMGCSTPGNTFAYVRYPAATLKFNSLKTARLVGALTKEICEGEVLLPKGSIFQVTSVDKQSRLIFLEEIESRL